MATRMVRWTVAKAALDVLRETPGLSGVTVSDHFPGDAVTSEAIWTGEIDGEISYPNASGQTRKQRDEMFTVPIVIRVTGGLDFGSCRDRLEEILATVESVFADFTVAVYDQVDGLLELTVADPVSDAQDTPIGALGFARIDLLGHARLT